MSDKVNRCRICGKAFFPEPLLKYDNMPKAAQFMPDASSLASERGVSLCVCQCSGCGLVQIDSEPVPYYREVVRASAFSSEMNEYREKQFGEFVERYRLKGKKVIEIGCGRGEYLALMKKTGVDAHGLEYSEASVSVCIKNGMAVERGFIDDAAFKLENAPYDAFFMMNYFEHLPDPNTVLAGISNNLTKGGIGLIEVPNFDMVIRKGLFSEFVCDHLFYFTMETLEIALMLNGFEIIDCREIWYDYIISAVVRKRDMLCLEEFKARHAMIKAGLDEYIGRFGERRVAIWGAGHQALALLSLMGLAKKIKYVVDSAPFKQGKFTPATHIPIVAPSALEREPVDAVIVMAGGYSDEVARNVKERYDSKISITILRDHGLENVR